MSTVIAKQGIVSILGSDRDQVTLAASLRRTLSADMSSKKWLAQNGFSFSPMKRIASSEDLMKKPGDSSSYKDEEERGQDHVWGLIQSQKKEVEKPCQVDIWGSIVSQKAKEEENSILPPPYVHPLVRRSSSSLSEKSLEICTESLGSETGSDKISSYGDAEEEENEIQVAQPRAQLEKVPSFDLEEPRLAKFNLSTTKKSPSKSFPPPLPSLAQRDGPSLHMQPRREDGRLVLKAITIPSKNSLCAHRKDGRLLLTFSNNSLTQELDLDEVVDQEEDVDEVEEGVLNYFEKVEDDCMEEKEEEIGEEKHDDENDEELVKKFEIEKGCKELVLVMDQAQDYSNGIIYVHRSALLMKNLIGLSNRDPKWTEKLKETVNLAKIEMEMNTPFSQSVPRPPMMSRMMPSQSMVESAASFNAYDYFWRTKPTIINPITQEKSAINNFTQNVNTWKINKKQEIGLLRGNNEDLLVPLVRGCNDNKKSLLFWEPYCISTSCS